MKRSSARDFITTIDTVAIRSNFNQGHQELSSQITTEQFSYIKNCNYLLAAEIINFWLSNQQQHLDFKKTLTKLGITIQLNNNPEDFSTVNKLKFDWIKILTQGNSGKIDLLKGLKIKVEYLFENIPVDVYSLEYIEQNIAQWYQGNKSLGGRNTYTITLQRNSIILRDELKKRFQSLVNSFWHQTSLTSIVEHLKMLELFLFKSIRQFAEKRKEYTIKERGCLDVYNKCISAINSREDLEWNYNIAKKALTNSYNFKFKAEIYCRAGQALKDIMKLNQLYIYDLNHTYACLAQIKADFLTQSNRNIHPLSPLLIEQMFDEINLPMLRQEIEQEIGLSLYKWGVGGGIITAEIRSIILKRLYPFTQKFCAQIFIQLAQEFEKNNLQGTHT